MFRNKSQLQLLGKLAPHSLIGHSACPLHAHLPISSPPPTCHRHNRACCRSRMRQSTSGSPSCPSTPTGHNTACASTTTPASNCQSPGWHSGGRTCWRSHMRQSTRWQRLRCSAKAMRSRGAGLNLTLRQACGTEAVQQQHSTPSTKAGQSNRQNFNA